MMRCPPFLLVQFQPTASLVLLLFFTSLITNATSIEHIPTTFVTTARILPARPIHSPTNNNHTRFEILHHDNHVRNFHTPPSESNGHRTRRQTADRHLGGWSSRRHRAAQRHHNHIRNAVHKPYTRSTATRNRVTSPQLQG
jgi:hypothetical protein